jgi:hypothetical protein
MAVLKVEQFGAQELLAKLRTTRLRGHGQPLIYEQASLEVLPRVSTDNIAPAQHYLLRQNVERILALRDGVLQHGVDIFDLDGGCWVTVAEGETRAVLPVLPPIIEVSRERGGRNVWLISDGMHRVWGARLLGMPISIVLVRDVPPEYPYYAYPCPGGWSDVRMLDALPDGFQKKEYRVPSDHKALFRDYDAVFPGVQEVRKRTSAVEMQ